MTPADLVANARRHLRIARVQLAAAHAAQPRDRHFRGLPECPDVIALNDVVETWERGIAYLERRARLAAVPVRVVVARAT